MLGNKRFEEPIAKMLRRQMEVPLFYYSLNVRLQARAACCALLWKPLLVVLH